MTPVMTLSKNVTRIREVPLDGAVRRRRQRRGPVTQGEKDQRSRIPCSPARIGDGAVAWHSDGMGSASRAVSSKLLLPTMCAASLASRKGRASLGGTRELPNRDRAAANRSGSRWPRRPAPTVAASSGTAAVLRGSWGRDSTFSWVMPVSSRQKLERRKSHRPDERLKLGPLRFGAINQQQHGADFDRLFFRLNTPFFQQVASTSTATMRCSPARTAFDIDIIHGRYLLLRS